MGRPRGTKRERERAMRGNVRAAVGYIRVSTVGQATEGHSLAGQAERIAAACQAEGYRLLAIYWDVASGGRTDREGLRQAQATVDTGRADALAFAKLDRVTRSLQHGAGLVEWARAGGHTLLASDEGTLVREGTLVQESLPFMLAMACVERERISRRTREGLAAARAAGVQLGAVQRTRATDPAAVRARELRAEGLPIARIAESLNSEGHRTARGNLWASGNTYTLLRRVAPDLLPEGGHPIGGSTLRVNAE